MGNDPWKREEKDGANGSILLCMWIPMSLMYFDGYARNGCTHSKLIYEISRQKQAFFLNRDLFTQKTNMVILTELQK